MFAEYLDRGLIEKNDISTYESMDEILNEIGKASLKDVLKNSKKDILIVHQDDEWLCFKPLTHDSSIAYGHGSKWCTAMKFEPEYFYRHSVEGILIYAINKVNGRKYGFYGNKYQKLSVWEDTGGQVDSLLTNMPQELLFKLNEIAEYNKNYFFSDKFFKIINDELINNISAGFDQLLTTNTYERFLTYRSTISKNNNFVQWRNSVPLPQDIEYVDQLHQKLLSLKNQ